MDLINNNFKIKCVLLGNTSAGKTSIMERYIRNSFNPSSQTTLGAMFFSQKVTYNNIFINIDFWDTAGQERYHSLVPMYVRDTNIVILVYDTNNKESFLSLKKWVKYIDNNNNNNKKLKIILIGTKIDLEPKVTENDITNFTAQIEYDFYHIKVSSKNNINFDELKKKIIDLSIGFCNVNFIYKYDSTNIEENIKPKNNIFKCC